MQLGVTSAAVPGTEFGAAQCLGAVTSPVQWVFPVRAVSFCSKTALGRRVTLAELISIGVFSPRISACTLRNCALPDVPAGANPCQGPDTLASSLAAPSAAG